MKKSVLILWLLACAWTLEAAQPVLSFQGGRFKIVQFTDLHWMPGSDKCARTEATLRAVLQAEKPALAVLTGDVITHDPAEEGWRSIMRIFEEERTPFTVTLGNHDAEYLTREQIFDIVMQSPYYVGDKGPVDIKGCGNTALPIYGSDGKGKVEAVLYCIDSNDYLPANTHGEYDWIRFEQIAWYRDQSRRFAEANGGKPLPSLAFFHIPLPEYRHVIAREGYFGSFKDEGVGASELNSGLLSSFVDRGDVMGMFVGHDHGNDFIGLEQGVALAYGRTSGWDAYGLFDRGGRVIELYEGEQRFDTWIRTEKAKEHTFYYPSALTSKDEEEMAYLPAIKASPREKGVAYTYYEGTCKHSSDIPGMKRVSQGVMPAISIAHAPAQDHFAYEFEALIKIDRRGVYRFYTYSDDGSLLYIDNQKVVDNDGGHSARRAEGVVALEAGWHKLRVVYFENYMGQALEVGYTSRDTFRKPFSEGMLYVP